jgi:hypothetical protein
MNGPDDGLLEAASGHRNGWLVFKMVNLVPTALVSRANLLWNVGRYAVNAISLHSKSYSPDSDFLQTWTNVNKYRLFDSDWALSHVWLKVDLGPHPRAWDYGDVSCRFNDALNRTVTKHVIPDTISISKVTPVVIALVLHSSYEDEAAWSTPYVYSADFALFKAGGLEPIATSQHSSLYHRSVNIEIPSLEPGNYIVHVRTAINESGGSY